MKRLVVCCDGTWQSVENTCPTNVLKLAQAIETKDLDDNPQIVFYDSGVGAVNGIGRYIGGAFGTGIDEKIQAAYRFLASNYDSGDKIYLFGFSRGAYTVRSLAGLIYKCGLVERRYLHKTPEAYALYRLRREGGQEVKPGSSRPTAFRREYGDRKPIAALGCWDTVGSRGIPNTVPVLSRWVNRRYEFYDTTLNPSIERAFHAVAIDEIRAPYDVTRMDRHHQASEHQVTQVWFPGEHSCVGGGVRETRGLSDTTLDWMISMIAPLGLKIDREKIQDGLTGNMATPFDNRPKSFYRMLGTTTRVINVAHDRLSKAARERRQKCPGYDPPNLAGIDLAQATEHVV
ncbi:MAG: DUF2235 domain-containing protein [Planctomycetia bacterium]|nr:DUF2235 domain-containing protein [Planctomycetia bacterium]